jgi:hypothetical protein
LCKRTTALLGDSGFGLGSPAWTLFEPAGIWGFLEPDYCFLDSIKDIKYILKLRISINVFSFNY